MAVIPRGERFPDSSTSPRLQSATLDLRTLLRLVKTALVNRDDHGQATLFVGDVIISQDTRRAHVHARPPTNQPATDWILFRVECPSSIVEGQEYLVVIRRIPYLAPRLCMQCMNLKALLS